MRDGTAKPERLLALAAAGILGFLFVWFEFKLLLLAFAGLLLSIVLHACAAWIADHTRLKPFPAYLATLFAITGIVAAIFLVLAPRVLTQLSEAATVIPHSIQETKAYLLRQPWGPPTLRLVHRAMQGNSIQITTWARDTFEGLIDLVIIVVIGFFGALNPRGYREGLLSLVPIRHRNRARELSDQAIFTLRSWLLGQLIPMAVLGIASIVGLWALGVPLAFTVGLLTGVLIFIPYVGSVSSGIVAILLALQQSTHTALWVLALYCVFHLMEGYILTPMVQKRAVRLPPVLTVLSQVCLWNIAGVLGVAVAAPLAAVGLVLVKELCISGP